MDDSFRCCPSKFDYHTPHTKKCAIIEHMNIQTSLPGIEASLERSDLIVRTRLDTDIRKWWNGEHAKWDAQVTGDDMGGADLWEDMPTVDSKTVARMSPLFKRHIGQPLDIQRIRRGGYHSIEDVIQHLVYENHGCG